MGIAAAFLAAGILVVALVAALAAIPAMFIFAVAIRPSGLPASFRTLFRTTFWAGCFLVFLFCLVPLLFPGMGAVNALGYFLKPFFPRIEIDDISFGFALRLYVPLTLACLGLYAAIVTAGLTPGYQGMRGYARALFHSTLAVAISMPVAVGLLVWVFNSWTGGKGSRPTEADVSAPASVPAPQNAIRSGGPYTAVHMALDLAAHHIPKADAQSFANAYQQISRLTAQRGHGVTLTMTGADWSLEACLPEKSGNRQSPPQDRIILVVSGATQYYIEPFVGWNALMLEKRPPPPCSAARRVTVPAGGAL